MIKNLFFLVALFVLQFSFAQYQTPRLIAKKINAELTIDGTIDESIWETAQVGDSFWEFFPTDSVKSSDKTEFRILFDEENLYIGIKAYTEGNNYNISTLKRDFNGRTNDNISIILDTYSDGNNAYQFGISPAGVVREALISNGGQFRFDFNRSWDTRWRGEAKTYDGYYTAEIEIPFNSIKFKAGSTQWRIQCYRFDNQSNTQSAWSRVPQNQLMMNLGFLGTLDFEEPLGKSNAPIELIPYANLISSRDFSEPKGANSLAVGGDIKLAIGNNMNMDITLNPDFSNVEVDDVVTNLTRFEVSLPEKRQFFIDNSDLFGSFGSQRDANPFFSRRIGIATDKDGNTIENKIVAGVRLSGKLNEDWRLGFLDIQTAQDLDNGIAANNNSMLALQKKVFSRSNIGLFFLNRQATGENDFLDQNDLYNRVLGVDYNLASSDSKWRGSFYMHKSFEPSNLDKNTSSQAFLMYNSRQWRIGQNVGIVGANFRSDLGFILRTDVVKSSTFLNRNFYPNSTTINRITAQLWLFDFWQSTTNTYTDNMRNAGLEIEFKNQSNLAIRYAKNYTLLTFDYEPTAKEGALALAAGNSYNYNEMRLEYSTNQANRFSVETTNSVGQFFNGHRLSTSVILNYRMPPKVEVSLLVNYNKISLPAPYSSADIMLIRPKVDISFTKNVYWSTIVQYANQLDNLGINSRLQWRYAPLSDLYLVYNDNYFVNIFEPKFRSINLKWSYRFPM